MFLELDEVDSTNEEAKRQIQNNRIEHGSVIWAKKQTDGRGRMQRQWESPEGNLYFSMIVEPDFTRASLPQYAPFFVCIVASVIAWHLDDPEDVGYKWPNDILIKGKKVAGILIETAFCGDKQALIVGIGVNIVSFPQKTFFPATDMVTQGAREATDFSLISRILSEYDVWWQFWHAKGFGVLVNELRGYLYGSGQMMRIQVTPNKWVDGLCRGIDDNGCLLLENDDGKTEVFHAGDVFML